MNKVDELIQGNSVYLISRSVWDPEEMNPDVNPEFCTQDRDFAERYCNEQNKILIAAYERGENSMDIEYSWQVVALRGPHDG